jgi:hypothetical protein
MTITTLAIIVVVAFFWPLFGIYRLGNHVSDCTDAVLKKLESMDLKAPE